MDLQALRSAVEQDGSLVNLEALRDGIAGRMRSIDEMAGDDNLTDEQAQEWESLSTEHGEIEQRIEQRVETANREQRQQRVNDSRKRWQSVQFGQRVDPFADGLNVRGLSAQESRSRALAVIDREQDVALTDDVKARAERLVRSSGKNVSGALIAQRLLLTENPHYRDAFMQLVTNPQPMLTSEQAQAVRAFEEFRAMTIGTGSEGGFGIPVLIDPTIILTAQGHPNDILGLARVETITTDEWKGVTSAGVSWQFSAEAAATTDNSPTLAQPNVPTHRADGYIPYSIEVGMDYPSFAMEMQSLLSAGYSELLVDKLTQGSGSDQPTGILTALDANTNVEVELTTASEIGAGDLNGLWAALPIRYRNPAIANTAWMTSTQVNGVIQQLGTDAGSAFTVNFTEEGVVVLKGRRAFENDFFDDLPASGTGVENLAVVGDWRNFLVAQRAGMSIELVPHVFDVTNNVPTGERAWFAWARVGSDSINDLGFRMLKNSST